MKKIIFLIIAMLPKAAMSYEAAEYKIIKTISKNIEIREYQKLVLATISNNKEKSENNNFKALFNFISGQNTKNKKIKMTIPVFKEEVNNQEIMSFVMPKNLSKSNIPKPNNKNIRIKIVKKSQFIAINFSGRSSTKNFNKNQKILEQAVKKQNISADLTRPINAYYNSPWTLPFFKRNEVLFKLKSN